MLRRIHSKPRAALCPARLVSFSCFQQKIGLLGVQPVAEFIWLLTNGQRVSTVLLDGCGQFLEILTDLAGRTPTPEEIQDPALLVGRCRSQPP